MNNPRSPESRIEKIKLVLNKRPFYVLLLPLFFILHGVRENFGFITPKDAASLFLIYGAGSLLVYLVFYALYRKQTKAGLLTFLVMSLFFFYGALQDFLKAHVPQLNRYTILLPFFLAAIILTAIFLKRTKKELKKQSLFLNLLLLLLSGYDLAAIVFETLAPEKEKFSIYSLAPATGFKPCNDCAKPDVYFLLFDEYASSACLKNYLGYDNSRLDTYLVKKQFQIQKNSSANYNFTPFSMASILNMSYINGFNPTGVTIDDYARCSNLIRENEVINLFSSNGYEIINYSIFDLAGNPSPVFEDFLPLKTMLISSRTFWGRVKKDLLWNLLKGKFELKWFSNNLIYQSLKNNKMLVDRVKEESLKKNKKPRFVYAHYYMPHPPHYFDKNGNLKEKELIKRDLDSKDAYLDNVKYTNGKIEELVNTIQTNSHGDAVIIVMGDHGFRHDPTLPKAAFLENLNAVYLPDKNYHLFYDSMTAVNQFRVLANTLFKQNITLLKDSTTFLMDKGSPGADQ